ncbi:MAG: polyketide synthase dehydratase domain-containing protein, partial [Caldilineaceae bacterium]|nr:polyketide synthase dehydratase domain-containing protein [Caldilineaceae bacterium]
AEQEIRTVQVIFDEAESGSLIDFQVLSYNETVSDAPLLHATGKLSIDTAAAPSTLPLSDLQECCTEPVDPATVVNILAEQVRVDLGPSYLWGDAFWRGETGVLSKLRLPATEHSIEGYPLFPGLFDACMQGIIAYHADKVLEPAVPFAIDTFTFYGGADSGGSDLRELWCYAEAAADDRWHLHLADAQGRTILRCEGLLRRAFPQSAALSQQIQRQWFYEMTWLPAPPPAIQPTATEESRLWFLIDNSPDTTAALQGALQTQGEQVVRVLLDPSADPASFNIGSNGHLPATVHLNPQADYQPLFAALLDKAALHHPGQVMGCNVLYLCGDAAETEGDSLTPDQLPAHTLQLAGSLLHTVQALSHSGMDARLWIVTQGAQAVTGASLEKQASSTQAAGELAAQGALWGLGRTIAREYPQLHCTCIDLSPATAPAALAEQILQECRQASDLAMVESQLAYRAGERYVAR